MGIILDSSVLIAGERAGLNPNQLTSQLALRYGNEPAAISVLSLAELAHGAERANSIERRTIRQRFIYELSVEIAIEPVTSSIALRAGKIDGNLHARGIIVSMIDLLIGATAIDVGFSLITHNVRHFERIPGLAVITV